MKSELLSFIKYLVIFTVFAGFSQYLITEYSFGSQELYYNVAIVYTFLFFITLLLYTVILYTNKHFSEHTGYVFIISSVFKMIFSVLFLLPIINKGDKSYIADVITFFIPYFLYLFFETVFVVKLLQSTKQ